MAYNPETLSFTVPETDMIYVAGLPTGITEEEIAKHFGTIGVLKQARRLCSRPTKLMGLILSAFVGMAHCKHADCSVLLTGQEEGKTKDLAVPRQSNGRPQGALALQLWRLLCAACGTALVARCCHQKTYLA